MSEITNIRLKTEIDQDKVDRLKNALDHFEQCQFELRKAAASVSEAVYAMQDALTVKRVDA